MLAVEGSSKIQGQQRFWVLFFLLYNCECCLIGRGKEYERRERIIVEQNLFIFICCVCCNRWITLVFDLYFGHSDIAMNAIDPSV